MVEQPFILCGLGRIGWRVLEYLLMTGQPVVVIDTRCAAGDPRLGSARLVVGDCRQQDVLEKAGVANARGVLIVVNDDLVNISTALMVRHLHSDVRIVMRLFNQNLIPRLGKAVHNIFALSTSALTAPLFAFSALTGQALGSIRLDGTEEGLRQVAELTVAAQSPACDAAVAALASREQVQVLAHLPQQGKSRLLLDVDSGARLAAGDRLIVCGQPERIAALLGGELPDLPHVLWAGWLRRMGRVVWQTLSEVDWSVKLCTSILLAVILISTLVLYARVREFGIVYAFYRTISIMATAGDIQGGQLRESGLLIFASVLRLAGAALVAAFTAILTNYLLRIRLGGALEFRRMPDSGHVIVCGLGNIGFRVVEELLKLDARVVVIEQSRDSRFVTTARRLGVPVLLGDATVSGILQQAHAAQARAVIASTSDDLINLEIALLVRELNPDQRIVLHLSDPNLAKMLREAANVRLALSIPMLAAPAFVAALFGDRVQTVFMIDGRLLATVNLAVAEGENWLNGRVVNKLAAEHSIFPLAVVDRSGMLLADFLSTSLEPGYRLVAVCKLADLDRLFRRDLPQRT
jgi:Trk K+ transport system NAD-binding subunit